jgi:riboflavin biosynthesis pyrimidine reductase
VLLGGEGMTNALFVRQGLVDELLLGIKPLLFGKGVPLVAGEQLTAKLKLVKVRKLSSRVVQLRYKKNVGYTNTCRVHEFL